MLNYRSALLASALFTTFPVLSSYCGETHSPKVTGPGVLQAGGTTIFYPPAWGAPSFSSGQDLKGGIYMEYRPQSLSGQGQTQLSVDLRQFNCSDCYGGDQKASMTDLVADMQCQKARRFEVPYDCGTYFSREKHNGVHYYYFSSEQPAATQITVLFTKNGLYYVSRQILPKGTYQNYKPQLDYVIRNFRASPAAKPQRTRQ